MHLRHACVALYFVRKTPIRLVSIRLDPIRFDSIAKPSVMGAKSSATAPTLGLLVALRLLKLLNPIRSLGLLARNTQVM